MDELRAKVGQQRILIRGLSKKLGVVHECIGKLQATWPAIHKDFFPVAAFNKRKQK